MNQQFNLTLQRMGMQEITRPLFYNAPQCLRFEIGTDQPTQKAYLSAALRRARTLHSSLPNPPDILRIDFCTEEDSLEAFLMKTNLPAPQEAVPADGNLRLYWNLAQITIDIENLLREIIRADFGGIWQLISSVFFMDTKSATIFYLYDDRGADLASADKAYLKSMYQRYDRWILEYDRHTMLQMLKEESP